MAKVDISGQGWYPECDIEWIVYGTDTETWSVASRLERDRDFRNSNNKVTFIVNKHTLTALGNYKIYFRLYAKNFNQPMVYSTSKDLRVVTAPYNGVLDTS